MAILGNSGDGVDQTSLGSGRMWAAKWDAPTDGVATEFHIEYDSGQETFALAVYGPGSVNQGGALLSNAGVVQTNTLGLVHLFITGLLVPFSAGDVWLAAACETNFGGHLLAHDGGGAAGEWTGISVAKLAGAYPPPEPFPTPDFGPDDRKFRMWLVYDEPAPPAGYLATPAPPMIHGRGAC